MKYTFFILLFSLFTLLNCKNSSTLKNEKTENLSQCKDPQIESIPNKYFDSLFTRKSDGWTGGDATYSIALNDSTNLWIFGDTFLGKVHHDKSRDSTESMINNTLVIQKNNSFETLYGGTTENPESFLKPKENNWWYWPGHGQIYNNTLQLVMFALGKPDEDIGIGFEYKAIDLVTLSLPDLKVISTQRRLPFTGTNYGAFLLQENGYTYIYGARREVNAKYLHVARVKGTDISQPWEYLSKDDQWTNSYNNSKPLFESVAEQFSIFKRKDQYFLMTQNYNLDPELFLYSSPNLLGPFANQQTLYCTPETKGNIITYNAFVHEQFSTEDNLLISYNINSLKFEDVFSNADNYRPRFVNVTGWNTTK
ncbi:DUF5005 domain-containing protein [Winogradskyella bathintestinalis]|uniref:DUF5005 domain-containing protein n=1 Tax=Winogradskyella bathintestinalis TaxID=3035208 RepID=A0ABT7ZX23_9FLAO|nr:DUF5005 domain-containing protein [Winogradskyella bathintestinalis]MDN3493529.1 DUF5005 domain-containing protein [Winogradskyella bathintestinalis]